MLYMSKTTVQFLLQLLYECLVHTAAIFIPNEVHFCAKTNELQSSAA